MNDEVIKLRKELGEAFKELKKQEEIITKLIQMGEAEEEDDYEEEDSSWMTYIFNVLQYLIVVMLFGEILSCVRGGHEFCQFF